MNPLHVLTNIKNEVIEQKNRNNLLKNRQMKYFTLYLQQITLIQRQFRKYLVKKTLRLEKCLLKQIQLNKNLKSDRQQFYRKKDQLILHKQNIKSFNVQDQAHKITNQFLHKVKQHTSHLFQQAQNISINRAAQTHLFNTNQRLNQELEQLKAQIQALQFQQQCHYQKKKDWNQKCRQLRDKITIQKNRKTQLEKHLKGNIFSNHN